MRAPDKFIVAPQDPAFFQILESGMFFSLPFQSSPHAAANSRRQSWTHTATAAELPFTFSRIVADGSH